MRVRITSIESYREVMESGYVGRRQKEVYNGFHEFGPCTVNELWQHIGGSKRNVQANIHARANELKKAGLLDELPRRMCSVTGKKAFVYRTNDNRPKKPNPYKKIKCSYCKGKGYVEQGEFDL